MSNVTKAPKNEVAVSPLEQAKNLIIKADPKLPAQIQQAALAIQKVKVVSDEVQKVELTGYIKLAKTVRASLETVRKNETGKLDDAKKTIMQAEKDIAAQLDSMIAGGTKLIQDYNAAVIKKQQEEEARIAAEQKKALARLSSPKSIAAVEVKAQAQLQTVQQATGVQKVWVHSVVDISKVPAEYLMINDAAIKAAIKNGVREIPGIKIEQETRTVIR